MTNRIFERIQTMDLKELASLEANAKRLSSIGTAQKKSEAEAVLSAILDERIRRQNEEAQRKAASKQEIESKVKDAKLFDRVVMAFEAAPPADWEAEALRVIAEHPGKDYNELARLIGKRKGSYINLAVGTLCRDREVYLGPAPWMDEKKRKKFFSGLLVDQTLNKRSDGSSWRSWYLKPEAEAALRHLGILRR
jgi:hypothetical protein